MGIVNRAAPDEPEERPTELGRALLRIAREHPGEWRAVFESERRETAVRIEGCLIGRGAGRIAGVTDIRGWDARVVEHGDGDHPVWEVRVKYSGPVIDGQQSLVK